MKIVIAYDQQLVAEGLECILSGQKNISVIGLLKNDEHPFSQISELKPDLVIFEFAMWMAQYPDLVSKYHSEFPTMKILIVSEMVSHAIIKNIMPLINGYVVRTCSGEKIVLAIKEIVESGKYLCPKVIDKYFDCTRTVESESTLTSREREVLCTWIQAKGNDEIADNLHISRSTVRTHMNNIRQKLGNLNHLQLMIYACKQNIMNRNFRPICPNCRSFCN